MLALYPFCVCSNALLDVTFLQSLPYFKQSRSNASVRSEPFSSYVCRQRRSTKEGAKLGRIIREWQQRLDTISNLLGRWPKLRVAKNSSLFLLNGEDQLTHCAIQV
jgi:hypothetical protein